MLPTQTLARKDDLGFANSPLALPSLGPRPILLLKFVAYQLWDPVKRAEDPTHGMPAEVEKGLRARRLLRAAQVRPAPCRSRQRATTTAQEQSRLQPTFWLNCCWPDWRAPGGRARSGSASGRSRLRRRRQSELAALRIEDLTDEEPVRPADQDSPLLPSLSIRLGRTKTTASDDDEHALLGQHRPAGADAAIGQSDPETPPQTGSLDPALFSAHGLRRAI